MSIIHWFRWLVYVQWVSLDTHSASIQRQFQLNATITPSNAINQNLVWTSSNSSIATVDNKWLVTPVWEGNCTITVTLDWYSDSCTLAVSPVRVTWVTLNKNSISLNVWETEQLTATVNPSDASNPNVTWSSSNTSIATVSSTWLVTAIWDGTVTITVTTVDWWFTATCSVECVSFVPVDTCFWYTGNEQSILLQPHEYKIEVWWAQWWYYSGSPAGKWWYAVWCINITSPTCLYIYVWWVWCATTVNSWQNAWWYNWWWAWYNYSTSYIWTWWGWWTDVRIGWNTLYHRRIVAGWGWGWWYYSSATTMCWWVGWWTNWVQWWAYGSYPWWNWWTQTSWWYVNSYACYMVAWSFWQGWYKTSWYNWYNWSWGWGWWYWGWAGSAVSAWGWGWSWYVYTSSTCSNTPSWYCHCTAYYFTNACCCCWAVSFPSPSWSTETWHAGCGCVKITSL